VWRDIGVMVVVVMVVVVVVVAVVVMVRRFGLAHPGDEIVGVEMKPGCLEGHGSQTVSHIKQHTHEQRTWF
jgi:hypothetical protein